MKKSLLLILSLGVIASNAFAQVFYQFPIAGKLWNDYVIVNHVDLDTASGSFKDYHCGSKSYDGHQGTDFTLFSFKQMDQDVDVLAAADGIVIDVVDSFFDRNMQTNAGGFGNFICLKHADKTFTYYAHLKKNSAIVKKGDQVKAGDPIALVGSSGNSTDPHVHFEVWYDSLYLIDPFQGNCQPYPGRWINQNFYDSGFMVMNYSLIDTIGSLNMIREREHNQNGAFYTSDPYVGAWFQVRGLFKNDSLVIVWKDQLDQEFYRFGVQADRDYWYYYMWGYIFTPQIPENYSVSLYWRGSLVHKIPFEVKSGSNGILQTELKPETLFIVDANSLFWNNQTSHNSWEILTLTGQKVLQGTTSSTGTIEAQLNVLAKGNYIIVSQTNSGPQTRKFFIP